MISRNSLIMSVLAGGLLLGSAQPAAAVDINIFYLDAPEYGFNDTYLGAQRRAAFELTMQAIADSLQGDVPIYIDAYFTFGKGIYWGYDDGYPNLFWRDFPNGIPGINYPLALAKQLAGYDPQSTESDMTIIFNGDIDIAGGKYGERFYYGWDGIPGSDVDFITESAHAFLTGAGFYTLIDPQNGEYYPLDGDYYGFPDILSAQLASSPNSYWDKKSANLIDLPAKKRKKAAKSNYKLRWKGPNVVDAVGYMPNMYAPKVKKHDTIPYGVIDHFDPYFDFGQILWPYYGGPMHAFQVSYYGLKDMGWNFYY